MKTVVINLFAGPGAGKTTAAWEIASELKKRGYITEYVAEYAKELVWDGNLKMLDGSLANQNLLVAEQTRRIERLNGKVDFVVTDSPIMLNALYLKGSIEEKQSYEAAVMQIFSKYTNFSIFINRGKTFEQAGRIHNFSESVKIDKEVKQLLERHQIYFGSYYYQTVSKAIDNCIYTYERVNSMQHKNISEDSHDIKVDGHMGTWYVIDQASINGKNLFLVEHEEYGDEAACLIIDEDGSLVLENVYNGFDDYIEQLASNNEEYEIE